MCETHHQQSSITLFQGAQSADKDNTNSSVVADKMSHLSYRPSPLSVIKRFNSFALKK
jgi:hypothetical protein